MSNSSKPLHGRVALVTGGARGIGRAIVEHLASAGCIVGVLDLRMDLAEKTVAALKERGCEAMPLSGNVAEKDTIFAAAGALKSTYGRFDIMVSNAMWVRYSAISDITPDMVSRMIGTGFSSVVWGIQAAEKFMDNGGSIINIASAASLIGLPNALVYCGIKAGVLGLTRSASVDLGPRGIRVNAICPGSIPTEGVTINVNPEIREKRLAKTPMKRLGTVDDVAKVACYLASDESGFVSGEYIKVDGGATLANL